LLLVGTTHKTILRQNVLSAKPFSLLFQQPARCWLLLFLAAFARSDAPKKGPTAVKPTHMLLTPDHHFASAKGGEVIISNPRARTLGGQYVDPSDDPRRK